MKKLFLLFLFIFMSFFAFGQEYDDMYFNANDRKIKDSLDQKKSVNIFIRITPRYNHQWIYRPIYYRPYYHWWGYNTYYWISYDYWWDSYPHNYFSWNYYMDNNYSWYVYNYYHIRHHYGYQYDRLHYQQNNVVVKNEKPKRKVTRTYRTTRNAVRSTTNYNRGSQTRDTKVRTYQRSSRTTLNKNPNSNIRTYQKSSRTQRNVIYRPPIKRTGKSITSPSKSRRKN